MVLLRLRTDGGLVGLGEAVPLSLRGGARLAGSSGRWSARRRSGAGSTWRRWPRSEPLARRGGRGDPRRRRSAAARAGQGGGRDGALRPRRPGLGQAAVANCSARRDARRRCAATRRSPPATPRRSPPRPSAWAERGFETFKLKLGIGDDVATVRRRCARRSGPDARIRGRRQRRLEHRRGGRRPGRRSSRSGSSWPSSPSPTCASWPRCAGGDRDPDRRRRERRPAPRTRSGRRSAGACDLATVKLAKVGGIGAATGIAAELPVYLSSALDGPVGIAAAAHAAQALDRDGDDAGLAHGLATQLLFARHDRLARVELREGDLPPARRARASASRSTKRPSSGTACSGYRSCGGPDQPQHRARLGAGRGAGALRGPPTRSSPPARARPRWRWRCGASRRSRSRVVVDERSAGFFALGAAQATRHAGGRPLHLGHGGGEPASRGLPRPTRRACR